MNERQRIKGKKTKREKKMGTREKRKRKTNTVPAANFDCSEATEREATIGQVNRG